MKIAKLIFAFIFGVVVILGGIGHFANPEMYNPFIPEFLNALAVNYLTGIVELALGIGLFIPKLRRPSALGVFVLMFLFLPLHVMDVFMDEPAIGSKAAAYVRLPIQFVLIWLPLWIRGKRIEIS
jgi:uncharacterized membrane protein